MFLMMSIAVGDKENLSRNILFQLPTTAQKYSFGGSLKVPAPEFAVLRPPKDHSDVSGFKLSGNRG